MKKMALCVIPLMLLIGCANTNQRRSPQSVPDWVQDPEKAYPSADWVAAIGQGAGRQEAEDAAISALARVFKTDIASLTKDSQQFSQIVNDTAGKKSVAFSESKDYFSSQVKIESGVKALVGMETGVFQSADGNTWYANARMNRRECASRYDGMVKENAAIINGLLGRSAALESQNSFEAYSALNFAASIAQVTDNFQNILELLDPSAVNRKPGYGGAAAIKTRMLALAGGITVGLVVKAEDPQEAVTIRRALGAFFTGMGFKVNEQRPGDYTINAGVSFEAVETTQLKTCRWFLDAALEGRGGRALFSYTGQGRAAHYQDKEARRLALRDLESSIKEGDFAGNFKAWLGALLE